MKNVLGILAITSVRALGHHRKQRAITAGSDPAGSAGASCSLSRPEHRSPAQGCPCIFSGTREFVSHGFIMNNYIKILVSILAAAVCAVSFAGDKPKCQKTGKNCPMNDNKECNCGKSCDCGK
jgi:hypothetical protein